MDGGTDLGDMALSVAMLTGEGNQARYAEKADQVRNSHHNLDGVGSKGSRSSVE